MAKPKKHKLVLPPRYPRRDPRNLQRMRLAGNVGRMIQRYNKQIKPVEEKKLPKK